MANTYTLIQAQTLASSQASVTFSSIPATYTDLVLRHSIRATTTNVQTYIKINTSTASQSVTLLLSDGSGVYTYRNPDYPAEWIAYKSTSGNTANTFGSGEIYIPNYTVAQNKPFSSVSVTENNASDAFIGIGAKLWSNTAAITSLEIYGQSGDLALGSSFYLYGIKNS